MTLESRLHREITKAFASPSIKQLGEIAHHLDVPLWVLLVPNLPPEFVTQSQLGRLVRHVEEFLKVAVKLAAHH